MPPPENLDAVITDRTGIRQGMDTVMHGAGINPGRTHRGIYHVHHPVRAWRLNPVAPMPHRIPSEVSDRVKHRALEPQDSVSHVAHDETDPMSSRYGILKPQFIRKLTH